MTPYIYVVPLGLILQMPIMTQGTIVAHVCFKIRQHRTSNLILILTVRKWDIFFPKNKFEIAIFVFSEVLSNLLSRFRVNPVPHSPKFHFLPNDTF